MCKTCFNRGYNDYPEYSTVTIQHKVDYIEGYKKKQNEVLGPEENENTHFCKQCFENGARNVQTGIWCPPLSTKLGHYDSYEKGYYNGGSNVEETEQEQTVAAAPAYATVSNRLIDNSLLKKPAVLAGIAGALVLISVFAIPATRHSVLKIFEGNKESDTSALASSNKDPWAGVPSADPKPNETPAVTETKQSEPAKPAAEVPKQAVVQKPVESAKPEIKTTPAKPIAAAKQESKPVVKPEPAKNAVVMKKPVAVVKPVPEKKAKPTPVVANYKPHREAVPAKPAKIKPLKDEVAAAPKKEKLQKKEPAVATNTAKPDSGAVKESGSALAANTPAKKPQPVIKPATTKNKPTKAEAVKKNVPAVEAEASMKQPKEPIPRCRMVENNHPFRHMSNESDSEQNSGRSGVTIHVQTSDNGIEAHEKEHAAGAIKSPVASHRVGKYYIYHIEGEGGDEVKKEPYGGKFVYVSRRLLNENEVSHHSWDELTIMLNEIYARHNLIFSDDSLRHYFTEKYWYSGELNDVTALLSDTEKQNIALLKKHLTK